MDYHPNTEQSFFSFLLRGEPTTSLYNGSKPDRGDSIDKVRPPKCIASVLSRRDGFELRTRAEDKMLALLMILLFNPLHPFALDCPVFSAPTHCACFFHPPSSRHSIDTS